MAHRLFEDNGEWTPEASHTCNEVTILLEDVLNLLEEQVSGQVDLKDFHFVLNHAIGGFVADLSIRRRLGRGNEYPVKLLKSFPRLKNNLPTISIEDTIDQEG